MNQCLTSASNFGPTSTVSVVLFSTYASSSSSSEVQRHSDPSTRSWPKSLNSVISEWGIAAPAGAAANSVMSTASTRQVLFIAQRQYPGVWLTNPE